MQFAMPQLTPGVRLLIYVNAAVFLIRFLFFLIPPTQGLADALSLWFGVSPGMWVESPLLPPVWQVVTWGFVHSLTDPFHILFNMLLLYFLGTMLEGIIGTRRFLATYFSALLISGIATLVVGLAAGPDANRAALFESVSQHYPTTVGASGAVMCVVVAMAALRPTTRMIFILFPITLKTLALFYVGIDVFYMLLEFSGAASSNVARLAHLSGAAWGFLLVRRGWVWRDPIQSVEDWRARTQEKREGDDEQRLDELLQRINREGINSLSSGERAFLKRMSKRAR